MLKHIVQLSWADRFGIVSAMEVKPSDADICRVFKVTPDELVTAQQLFADGIIKVNPRINHQFYELFFKGETPEFPKTVQRTRSLPLPPDNEERRLFASQNKTVRPRGRKSNNIDLAFKAIPTSPVDVEKFAEKNHVSVAVLRQHKRFDKYPGTVFVRKNKDTGVTEVWRDPTVAAAPTE